RRKRRRFTRVASSAAIPFPPSNSLIPPSFFAATTVRRPSFIVCWIQRLTGSDRFRWPSVLPPHPDHDPSTLGLIPYRIQY
uniref:Uncharacterized protein n=1 Tax=Oryza nivara TaxID=4536 RepID=A0A0E0I8P5_ORYNI